MRRTQHFPQARASRRPPARLALVGASAALAVLLAAPAAGPHGSVLDLQGDGAAPAAIGQEPASPAVASPRPAAPAPATPATSGAPVTSPATASPAHSGAPGSPPATNAPSPSPSAVARFLPHGLLPSRLQGEIGGTTAPPLALLSGYRWPLAHPRLTLPFGPTAWGSRLVAGQPFHDGVDLATFCGDRITAAHDGTVLAAGRHYDDVMGWVGSLGPYYRRLDTNHLWPTLPIMVVTDDGNGYRGMYAHFERIVVHRGQRVRAGQLLGYEGRTGRATGCHLHYGLFSPWEHARFALKPDVAKRMKLPRAEIARIDPLKVLPPRKGINAAKPAAGTTTPGPSVPPIGIETSP